MSAYLEGREARRNNLTRDRNPYPDGPVRRLWDEGWRDSDQILRDLAPHQSASDSPLRTELTAIGEQYVIPGCEKDIRRGPKQPSLWDALQKQEKEAKP